MLDAIERIRRYTEGMDHASFSTDQKTFDAVVRNFEVIGEASKHVPESLRRHYTDALWQKLTDLRNKVSHDYADASPEFIWNTIHNRLGPLADALRAMLRELDE
jgi:uncharacterized protein with HEPN domain